MTLRGASTTVSIASLTFQGPNQNKVQSEDKRYKLDERDHKQNKKKLIFLK